MVKGRSLKNFIIEPFAQIRLGAYVLFVSLLFILLITSVVSRAFLAQYEIVLQPERSVGWEQGLQDVFNRGSVELAVVLILYVLALFFVVIRMTHRIYGPLVSINRFVEQLTKGEYDKRCTIRKDDDLKQLAHKLNELAAVLQKNQSQ